MDTSTLLSIYGPLASPVLFAALVGIAAVLMWQAFAPTRPAQQVDERLEGYIERDDAVDNEEMRRSFNSRVVLPAVRGLLRAVGRLAPRRSIATIGEMLLHAGQPGGLTALDFLGLRLIVLCLLGGGYLLVAGRALDLMTALRNAAVLAVLGYLLPGFWLRTRVRSRQHAIAIALPDALDMLTIGVEAGLAFESALVRVGEKWDNPLTREFRRTVGEMRVGVSREDALQRMADRCGVADLHTFVAVLVQSAQLGVTISQVLHTQAAEMRGRRRQHAEELARQAGIKMVFPLVFLVFPALFVVLLGPAAPRIMSVLGMVSSRGGR
jgi:tight adherence protein C